MRENVSVTTVSGERYKCLGTSEVEVQLHSGGSVTVSALVVPFKPLNYAFVLGMNCIRALRGVTVSSSRSVQFGVEDCKASAAVVTTETVTIDEKDFKLVYDEQANKWIVSWKWRGDGAAPWLKNSVLEYSIPRVARQEYENELCQWIQDGWLVPYNERAHGPVKGTIPLMAVVQENKKKVRPVLDFRELNSYVDVHTAEADICAEKLREWRRRGQKVALLDLRKAYLQIHVHPSLWSSQTVVFRGQRYCLTRLGFGLNIAPLVLKKVLGTILSWNEIIEQAASPYLDDIFVDEGIATAAEVEAHLHHYGLTCKPAERVSEGSRVLGIRVWVEHNVLRWRRDNMVCEMPNKLTRRAVFSICGRLTSHLPVCGWLRVVASYMKRRANATTASWGDDVDPSLHSMLAETLKRVEECDPARGRWDVVGDEATVWVDASSLAMGAAIEVNGEVIEDGCWLRKNDCSHINLAELDAVVKGLNLAISWKMKKLTLMTDSQTVCHWIADTLSGKARVKTKAASEMLIRRRLETVKTIVAEYCLNLSVKYVPSAENKADTLTRVPKKWLCRETEPLACGAVTAISEDDLAKVHETAGHPGIRRTLYFCRRVYPTVQRRQVQSVVRACQQCQSLDPAPERWEKGKLGVSETWRRVSMDICHVKNEHYLTLIDCGPARYTIWRKIRRQDTASVLDQLESVFFERGAPEELLTDNATSFRSNMFCTFASRWGMVVKYRCANVPSGNGISERCHRTVKTIQARKNCSVAEAVYRYNTMPKGNDSDTAPANQIFRYEVRLLDIDKVNEERPLAVHQSHYNVGDRVWIRHPSRRCNMKSLLGTVTKVVSAQNVEVDGMPRHVRDLRVVAMPPSPLVQNPLATDKQGVAAEDNELPIVIKIPGRESEKSDDQHSDDDDGPGRLLPRRGSRERRPARPFQYSDLI
ncbi:hypothetical protein Pmani_015641 [Petrolisthes manimaculis]|uniref:RNA-directed DNA polymerase n=1 Tax=Petrolisthes manimaculis TaxID=1843537 RepID=A0AAE1PQJ6_9EUCA|nr:hypothetical protein Pmani_015641 [Petrolisthes manimaculis]